MPQRKARANRIFILVTPIVSNSFNSSLLQTVPYHWTSGEHGRSSKTKQPFFGSLSNAETSPRARTSLRGWGFVGGGGGGGGKGENNDYDVWEKEKTPLAVLDFFGNSNSRNSKPDSQLKRAEKTGNF